LGNDRCRKNRRDDSLFLPSPRPVWSRPYGTLHDRVRRARSFQADSACCKSKSPHGD
jgi:hypothetical protein